MVLINDNLMERETIKLIKNSRGYTWEIKVNAIELTESTIDDLKSLDDYMKKTFEGYKLTAEEEKILKSNLSDEKEVNE